MKKEDELLIIQSFSQRVKYFRGKLGISQEKLAENAQLHRTYMGAIERAQKVPSLVTIVKIAKALNVDITDLIEI